MKIDPNTGWYDPAELVRCVSVIAGAAARKEIRWAGHGPARQVTLDIDQATGQFVIKAGVTRLDNATLVKMYPELETDSPDLDDPLPITTPV